MPEYDMNITITDKIVEEEHREETENFSARIKHISTIGIMTIYFNASM